MSEQRKRGRPVGSKQSDEAKAKISRARKIRATGGSSLPSAPAHMHPDTIREIVARDRDCCRGCHDPRFRTETRGGKKVRRVVPGFCVEHLGPFREPADPSESDSFALFCSFCAQYVAPQAADLSELPPRAGG